MSSRSLAETQRHLDALYRNIVHAKTLLVPDGSRQIFDTAAKLDGLIKLSIEMDDLLNEAAKEQDDRIRVVNAPELAESRQVVAKAYIPFA